MKKTLLAILFFVSTLGFSQDPIGKIQSYLNINKSDLGLTTADISDWTVKSTGSSKATKIDNYYIVQRHQGVEVYNSVSNVWYKNDEVINMQNSFVQNVASKINTTSPSLSVLDAFSSALNNLNENAFSTLVLEEKTGNKFVLSNGILSEDPIRAELVYQSIDDNARFNLAWHFEFYTQDYKHLWSLRIDAVTGELLEKHDGVLTCNFGDSNHSNHNHKSNFFFTSKGFKTNVSKSILDITSGSYRVIPFEIESPNHGSRQLVVTPHDVLASPYGWHDINGVSGAEYTYTNGNNVLAQEDVNGNNGNGIRPDGGFGLTFDFPYGGNGVAATTYTSASTTNLFYMNNIMHDVWYRYGFDEASGNFQQNNYGRGGTASDYVQADSQDGSGTNNANFSTPTDGGRPRMQMYLWNQAPQPTLTINSPSSVAGVYAIADNSFSPGHVAIPASPGLTRNLILFNDGVAPDTSDACTAAVNAAAINGNIAVIRRGDCTFAAKVKTAQNAGAAAVIIVNNVAGGIGMSGADATITIPAISMEQGPGEALILAMSSGTVNGTLVGPSGVFVNADGDFDNGIVAHEYGHGISTRLTGGRNTSCLSNAEQMGEGWSDFFALMLQMKAGDLPGDSHGIGTFAMSQPTSDVGIRSYAYSTNLSVNPFTFADSNTEVAPHGVGSVWATMLWDLAWAYVGKYGFDANKFSGTGGNNKVMQLVLDGLKLQGCNPTFVIGRNALIAADQATTGGQDYCLIWEVFAKRGLGVGASSGSANSSTDQVESFTEPSPGPNCTLKVNYFQNEDMIKVYPNPTNGKLNIRINNYTDILNIQIFDLNGRRVYSQSVNDFSIERAIDVQSLQKGMYLLKVDGVDLTFTKKIIIN